MNDGPIVAVRNLSKRFGKAPALDNVALDVHPGRIIGLLGTNAAPARVPLYQPPRSGTLLRQALRVPAVSRLQPWNAGRVRDAAPRRNVHRARQAAWENSR
jgi:ATPase subunit of ABC transporter with duplicated ATPase domains